MPSIDYYLKNTFLISNRFWRQNAFQWNTYLLSECPSLVSWKLKWSITSYSNLMPTGMLLKVDTRTVFHGADYVLTTQQMEIPGLLPCNHFNGFMQARDYSKTSFWDCHSGEGQGQLSYRRSSLMAPILGPSLWLGVLIWLVNSGRSENWISKANENSWKGPRTNAFFFREWKQFLVNCYNFKKRTPGFPGNNWTNLMIIHAEIYFLLIS